MSLCVVVVFTAENIRGVEKVCCRDKHGHFSAVDINLHLNYSIKQDGNK